MTLVSRPFSHFLFKLNEVIMNLLVGVKINSMTFTDRNLYTYKKIRFPFRNNYTWPANFPGVDDIVCFGLRISNYTQTHHKIHQTLACRQRKLNQNTILGALAINRAAFSCKVESKRSRLKPKKRLRITWSFRLLLDLFQQSQPWKSSFIN